MTNYSINKNSFDKISGGFSIPAYNVDLSNNTVVVSNPQVIQESPKDTFSGSEPKENNSNMSLGKKVLYSMLGIGVAVIALTKGLSGSTAAKLKKLAEDKYLNAVINNKTIGKADEIAVNAARKAKKWLS